MIDNKDKTVFERALRGYIEEWLGYEIRDFGHMIEISGISDRPDIKLSSGSYRDSSKSWEEMFFKILNKERNVYETIYEDLDKIYNTSDVWLDYYDKKHMHYFQLIHKHRMFDFTSVDDLVLQLALRGVNV